jgi:glycolate oxidase
MDGTIPLAHLPYVLEQISAICTRHGLKVANIFHAGDGNLHPLIMYDANDRDQAAKAELAGAEILKLCVEVGGCLSGEHGIGIEKRELMRVQFNDTDLALQMRIKTLFDPNWLLNAGKVFPIEDDRQREARAA